MLEEAKDRGNELKLITYLDREDNDSFPIDMGLTPLSKPEKYPWINFREINVSKEAIVNLLAVEIGKTNSSFGLATFMYLPNKIFIKLKTPEELISQHIRFTLKNRNEIEKYFINLSDIEHQLLIIEYLRKKGLSEDTLEIIKNKNKLGSLNKDFKILNLINERKWDIDDLTEKEKNLYIRKDGYFDLLHFDFMDKEGRRYNNLSDGEKKIFGQLLNIYFYTEQNDNVVFLFDEPDISLHPNWNKKYINEVIYFLKKFKGKKHFIVTSHSPFLLSDIPKQNTIFLDKYDDKSKDKYPNLNLENLVKGDCINVTDEIDIKPFGANIHNLLSHGFFMEDGLMGEFAKNKIQEIMDFLNNIKTIDEISTKEEHIKQVIESIGEPFLRRKLLDMYYAHPKYQDESLKEARKKELLAEQKRIKEELKRYD